MMKMVASIALLTVVVATGAGWFYFLHPKPLPPAADIREMIIVYNEVIGDLAKPGQEPKEFSITRQQDLAVLRALMGDMRFRRMPLIDSDTMDDGQNWILNIYFKDGSFTFISVDKGLVSDIKAESSPLYEHLKANYT